VVKWLAISCKDEDSNPCQSRNLFKDFDWLLTEWAGHPLSSARSKQMKSLVLHTNVCLIFGVGTGEASFGGVSK